MSLHEGSKIGIKDFRPPNDDGTKYEGWNSGARIWHKNHARMIVWMTVGADVENGLWGMLGSRLDVMMTNLTDWDLTLTVTTIGLLTFLKMTLHPTLQEQMKLVIIQV